MSGYNGVDTIRLKALNWSGGTVCRDATVYVDSIVELTERKRPTVLLPGTTNIAIIGPAGSADFTTARFFLL